MSNNPEESFRRAAEQAANALRQFGLAAEAAASAVAAECVSVLPQAPYPYPYPALRRAIRYALADWMR